MENKINSIVNRAKAAAEKAVNLEEINAVRVEIMGKSGEFTTLLRGMKDVAAEDRPAVGKAVNEARDYLTALIEDKVNRLQEKQLSERLNCERIDVTLDVAAKPYGSLHPCTLVVNEALNIFMNLGFSVKEGPEIEKEYYNFTALNIPDNHPSREMQDTFYINPEILLRTHTSPIQVRNMESTKPPIRIVCPGKVYRPDDDATHSPMFSQVEGLVVDKHVSLCDLKGLLDELAKNLFNADTETRLRPSHFPFTEPSVEVDVTCAICRGKGCRVCKGTGWIEILGAGVVNPKVLENCGINSAEYSGLAFGFGVERVTMIKYGIPHMRILFENDIRFLGQFRRR